MHQTSNALNYMLHQNVKGQVTCPDSMNKIGKLQNISVCIIVVDGGW